MVRTALLAALDESEEGGLRAELALGGRSVLAWQCEAVRSLGCEKVVCLTRRLGEEIIALQRAVEADGGEFHAVRSGLQLPGLIKAEDELVVMLDGLIAERGAIEAVACQDGALLKGVATIAASHPLAQSCPQAFERIDRERSWAGLIVMRAAPVQQLADLPGDGSTVSLLLRLALQAGTPCREIGVEALAEGDWLLATSSEVLEAREQVLIDRTLDETPWSGPGRALAQEIARRIAPRGLAIGPLAGAGLAALLMVLGAGLALLGWGATGLALASAGAFAAAWSDEASKLARELAGERKRAILHAGQDALLDGLASVALIGAVISSGDGSISSLGAAALGPFAIGLARLAAGISGPLARAFWQDRTVQLAIFALAGSFGLLGPVIALVGLAALTQLLLRSGRD
jgi:hypothetical protein